MQTGDDGVLQSEDFFDYFGKVRGGLFDLYVGGTDAFRFFRKEFVLEAEGLEMFTNRCFRAA